MVTRSMAAGGGCDSRSSSASVRSVRTSRIGDGSCRRRACDLARDEPQLDVQDRRAAIAALEARRQRLEQPRQHERQRLEPLDRPFEIERALRTARRAASARAAARPRRARSPARRAPACPSRDARSAGGSAASSPSVRMPQRLSTDKVSRLKAEVSRGSGPETLRLETLRVETWRARRWGAVRALPARFPARRPSARDAPAPGGSPPCACARPPRARGGRATRHRAAAPRR